MPFTPEEQSHVFKKLKTHHSNPDGTLSLQSGNHTNVKLLPVPTPHVGSSTSNRETRRLRSQTYEAFLHLLSSPPHSNYNEQQRDTQAQLTSITRRNTELVTSSALDAGVPILHKLTFDEMLQMEQITFMPNNTARMLRSFFNSLRLCIFPSEHKMRQHMKGMIPESETGIIEMRLNGEDIHVTFVRVTDMSSFIQQHIQHLSNTNQLVRYHNMPSNALFIETQADKGTYSCTT